MNLLLQKFLSPKNKIKVLVVGDIILDEYIWGNVERISPEAPVQILQAQSENFMPGGAANVANNLVALGCDVQLVGVIGNDSKGSKLIEILQEENVGYEGIQISDQRKTTNKTRIIAQSQHMLRIDNEDKRPIAPNIEQKIIDYLILTIPMVDGIICSDYMKGVLTDKILKAIMTHAKKNNKLVFVDPKGRDFSKYCGANILTPNAYEVELSSPDNGKENYDMTTAAKKILDMIQLDSLLVTKGKDGMCLFERGKEPLHIHTEAKEVFDVTGAGDTVIAAFARAALCKLSYVEAAKIANIAAGVVVGKVGAAFVHKDDLYGLLEENALRFSQNILHLNELKQLVSQAKSYQKTIVFTNGCFDIIHAGHIEYLQKASKLGDILIVGLNSDSSVKKLKGNERPIKKEQERASILAALRYVDFITIFDDDTPEKLISEIKPDIIVKGSDYTVEQVVGREIVEEYGGRVELVPIVQGLSTSALVKDIVKKYS